MFPQLFTPVRIGTVTIKNRFVMAPMASRFNAEDGSVTRRFIDFYVEIAKGGAGLIILENTCVEWPRGKAGAFPLRIDENRFIYGINELVEAVHPYGTKVATQLQHAGRQTAMADTEGIQPVSSSIVHPYRGDLARPLSIDEIQEIVGKFAAAASRTKQAGCDAVELHAAHGYLFTQFMSPFLNKRDDLYGGSFENRMRFTLEVIERCREAVGPEFPILFRFSADEHVPGGIDLVEAKRIAQSIEAAGVDAIDVSAGIASDGRDRVFPTMGMPEGTNVPLAEGIKKVVSVPVIIVGRISHPRLAEQIISEGKADLVALGRPLLADPHYIRKAQEGGVEDICPCIACNACIHRLTRQWRLGCAVNAACGREEAYALQPAIKSKRVVVIGGGPAGLEAARVAAQRGHQVAIYERSNQLGGQLVFASRPSFKAPLRNLIDYLVTQVEKAKAEIHLNTEVTSESLRQMAADVVILATGAEPIIPSLPGLDPSRVVTAWDVLQEKVDVGDQTVVIGGGQTGMDCALSMAQREVKVTLVEMLSSIGREVDLSERLWFDRAFAEAQVKILTNHRVTGVEQQGVVVMDKEWNSSHIPADTVVLATGARPNRDLVNADLPDGAQLYAIGDSVNPRSIYEAIHDAARAARQI